MAVISIETPFSSGAPKESKDEIPGELRRLGELLLASGAVDRRTLDRARRVASETGERLDRVMTQLGMVSERGLAEALAELFHKQVREELGIAAEDATRVGDLFHQKYRGSRYSFGYPACPNLEDQTKLFALLKPEENIGVRLTSGFHMEPEQSTSAIIVHHPQAKYFVV